MATITGNVFDLGSAPFPTAIPVVEIRALEVSVGGSSIHSTRKIEVPVASDGSFAFEAIGTGTVTPNPRPVISIRWMDPGDPAGTGLDVFNAPLHIPAGNGTYTIGQVIAVPVQAGSVAYGIGEPPDFLTDVVYIDISGTFPQIYVPTNGGI